MDDVTGAPLVRGLAVVDAGGSKPGVGSEIAIHASGSISKELHSTL